MSSDTRTDLPERWLERANRLSLVARLLSGATHDVNNALQVISGNAELLQSPKRTTEQIAQRSRAIGAKAHEASSVLADVQAFARDADESIGRVDLRAMAARALALRQFAISRARIDASLDPGGSPTWSVASARATLQILLNLVINAEECVTGRADAQIRLRCSTDAGRALVAVEDNGPGIAPELLPRLFDARLDSSPSLGIGLAVSQQLARAQQGSIAHASGAGCTMILSLPAAE